MGVVTLYGVCQRFCRIKNTDMLFSNQTSLRTADESPCFTNGWTGLVLSSHRLKRVTKCSNLPVKTPCTSAVTSEHWVRNRLNASVNIAVFTFAPVVAGVQQYRECLSSQESTTHKLFG